MHKSIRRNYEGYLHKHRIGLFDEQLEDLLTQAVEARNERYIKMVLDEFPELSQWVEFVRSGDHNTIVDFWTISDEDLVARQDRTGNFCCNPVNAEIAMMEMILDWLEDSNVGAIADIGCGVGHHLPFLVSRNLFLGKAYNVDLSPGYLKIARQIVKAERARVEIHQSSSCALPFADNELTHILSVDMLPWVLDWKKALQEFARVLSPGGRLLLLYNERPPRRLIRSAEVLSQLGKAGIDSKRLTPPDLMNKGVGAFISGVRRPTNLR